MYLVQYVIKIINSSQMLALFISIGFGYVVGQINFGKFKIGGICGTLIVSILVSLSGVYFDPLVKNLFFAIFIYAVGYDSGPQFLTSLNIKSLKHVLLAIFLSAIGLITVLICAKIFHFDKGTIAGIAAGALTQSSMLGSANDALVSLKNISSAQISLMQENMIAGFTVTYLFGVFSAILFGITLLELSYRQTIRSAAISKEIKLKFEQSLKLVEHKAGGIPQQFILLSFSELKIYDKKIAEIEQLFNNLIAIVKVKRDNNIIEVTPNDCIQKYDEILIFSRADQIMNLHKLMGHQINNPGIDWNINLLVKRIKLTNKDNFGNVDFIRKTIENRLYRGVCLLSVFRQKQELLLTDPCVEYQIGDVFEVYGIDSEVEKLANKIGSVQKENPKTNFMFVGFGFIVGLLLGMINIKVFGVLLHIDVVGLLLAGLFFGWLNHKNSNLAYIPSATVHFMQDFGLTVFIAGIGLSTGKEAIHSIMSQGIEIFIAGAIISIVPLFLSYLFGRYILKYDNVAVFAGALTGARSADPAFGLVLEQAGNTVPTISFAVSFVIANILLTVLGSVIVNLA